MPGHGATRRLLLFVFAGFFLVILFITTLKHAPDTVRQLTPPQRGSHGVDQSLLTGHTIAPKLGNETAKAELGRAAWKLFHTTFARFPENPTKDESEALRSYIHLFQRLYPCGECAEHFGLLLEQFPPQVSSRNAAAAWGCHVHNQVNKRLKKPMFDCANIGDFYDCGCADDDDKKTKERGKAEMSTEAKERITGTNGRDINHDLFKKPQLVRDG